MHVRYYDEQGNDEACFPAKLVREVDVLPRPNTHIDPDPKGPSEIVPHIYDENSGLRTGPRSQEIRAALHISGPYARKKW